MSLEDREHLLLRPDTLCGSTSACEHLMPLFQLRSSSGSATAESDPTMQFAASWGTLTFAPALRNLFQEILTNALDRQFRDETVRNIEVWVDCDDAGGRGWIRVRNDGMGVPVVFDAERNAWKPTIAFSHFRSGTNFVDGEGPRWTAGRNGYGCKATNVFSERFIVETGDTRTQKQFKQVFGSNMVSIGEPVIKAFTKKKGFTDVSFLFDYARLGCPSGLTPAVKSMIESTVVNAACCVTKKVSMHLNGTKIDFRDLRDYGALFASMPVDASKVAFDSVKQADGMVVWEVCAVHPDQPPPIDGIGFVNSLECNEGTHMNLALARTVTALQDAVKRLYKKGADFSLSPAAVKKKLFFTVRLMVDSPEFSSQTKEKLTTRSDRFGFNWQPSKSFVTALINAGVAQSLNEDAIDKELAAARRSMKATTSTTSERGRRMVVADKYDAATSLRTASGRSQCSLLVTEGDSARQLAVAGLAVVGREYFGIYALKGKPLNVRNATVEAISKNKEISTLLQILGLTLGKPVVSLDQLTYRKLVIFSDQDPDGAHIGGLVLNVIHALFPSLLELDPAFVQRFPTPLVRATHKRSGVVTSFYAKAPYDAWQLENDPAHYTIKYFKGLGTSTSTLAREYFTAYKDTLVDIVWNQTSDEVMQQMFANDNAAARRMLLQQHYNPSHFVDYRSKRVTYDEFLKKEVLPYANYSNERNIPSLFDGLKPAQRKALFTMLDKNVVHEVKVAQVAATIAAHTMYHHGEQSMVETVVGMAQDHVGVSNINLFRPEGQFGCRLDTPSEHSAARYIFTALDPVTRYIFRQEDDAVLEYREDEGHRIEPVVYMPIIPMLLVNGAFGIGTGWSTTVPMYDPERLIDVCSRYLDGASLAELCAPSTLMPWYDGFKGSIEYLEEHDKYRVSGTVSVVSGSELRITELPVGTWTHPYVQDIEQRMMCTSSSAGSPPSRGKKVLTDNLVRAIDKRWTDSTVDIGLHCDPDKLARLVENETVCKEALNLVSDIRIGNMHLHNGDNGVPRQYTSIASIMEEYVAARLRLYEKRRQHLLDQTAKELRLLSNKQRFVSAILDGSLVVHRLEDDEVIARLRGHGFEELPDYNYLLNMSYRSTTQSRLVALAKELDQVRAKQAFYMEQTAQSLWKADLRDLAGALSSFRERKTARYADTVVQKKRAQLGGTVGGGGARAKKVKQ